MKRAFVLSGLLVFALSAGARAQSGAGSSGASVLQLVSGSRAAALSGAYAAATGDADVIFYNVAGVASVSRALGFSYGSFVQDIALTSASGAVQLGPVVIGAGGAFLDAGSVSEVVPDPDFGGQRGIETGQRASASESAARFAIATQIRSRLRIGAAAGFVSTAVANDTRNAPLFDAGAQYDITSAITIGASFRNLGGSLGGGGLDDARLPSEARIGATAATRIANGVGVMVTGDVVSRLKEKTTGFAAGVEAGLLPGSRLSAVARAGYDFDNGDSGIAPLRLGAGLSLGPIALDYTYQNFDFFGATHRVGVRYARAPR